MWLQMYYTSFKKKIELDHDKIFHNNKVLTAKFYMQKIAPETAYKLKKIVSGEKNIMNLGTEGF